MIVPIPLPLALVLIGAQYWPVTLAITMTMVGIGCVLRVGWARAVCFVVAAILSAVCLLAITLPSN